MAAVVPIKRTEPLAADIVIGAPVRAQTWRELGMLLHWLRGHGTQIIPAHAPQMVLVAGAQTLHYRVKPQGLAIARVWVISLRQENVAPRAQCTITLPGGSVLTVHPRNEFSESRGTLIFETVTKSSARADLTLTMQRVSGTAQVTVESLCCFELPRAVLTLDATDLGVDFETLRPGAAIIDSTNRGLGAVAENLTHAVSSPRRHLHEQCFAPIVSDPGGAANPTAWVDLFPLALPVSPRRVVQGDTTYTATWDAWCSVSNGTTTFEVRIKPGSGGSAVLTCTGATGGTTPAWLGTSTISLLCEDPTTVDGVPAGGLETVQYAVRRTAGSGTVTLRSVAAWEE